MEWKVSQPGRNLCNPPLLPQSTLIVQLWSLSSPRREHPILSFLFSFPQGKPEADPLEVFANKVRSSKGLESRWAVLQGKEARVEYFRGKDFAAFLKEQTELQSFALEKAGVKWMPAPGGMSDVERIGQALIRAKLLIRCDRLVKTIRPGKKKLSKFPARLVEYLVSVCVACPFPSNETLYILSSIADSKCLKLR